MLLVNKKQYIELKLKSIKKRRIEYVFEKKIFRTECGQASRSE
jgi:hypothetical protein